MAVENAMKRREEKRCSFTFTRSQLSSGRDFCGANRADRGDAR